jgi:hypothetical protein
MPEIEIECSCWYDNYKNIQRPNFQIVAFDMLITNRRQNYVMDGKNKSTFHTPYRVTATTFPIIGIILTDIFVCTLA